MNILDFMAGTFSVRLPDGRFVYRPLGARGACYVMTLAQRRTRAWAQLAFYGALIALVAHYPPVPITKGVVIGGAGILALNYLLLWLYTFGLDKTEPPAPMTREQRHSAVADQGRALGRPLLWIMVIVSWLFALGGLSMVLLLGKWLSGLLCMLFFGACAAVFTWQLRLTRAERR
ncbi:hypothetical protein LK542_03115 [Massilia sp. IC2-477]|uniref:hypothetical protein n=1 Tax=Massilia sp. IC2-477 TaxID=2887198 RepID=UPI001D127E42|nr:hypothetical protein [Massilia sp. IC2-477]MCC2954603.1 hypothetical protein [Massilia sp. IC2-477]